MALHDGTSGSVKTGPSGTAIAVGSLTEWEFEAKTEVKKQGPFIGDANVQKVRAGKDGEGSMKGFTPVDLNPGQTSLMAALEGGTDIRIEMVEADGYTITVTTAIITSYKTGMKSDEGVPFECKFECSGGWTRVATP